MAYNIMVQGTMSNAGKSLLCAALCRIFRQDGLRAAPFKSQNMALNSFITASGGEMGRAQVVQAEAAGIAPDVRMNPILLKPTTDVGSQVIVNGQVLGNMRAMEYYRRKRELLPAVLEAYRSLAAEYDVLVIEGAGSPAEINLKQDDFVNMGLAKLVDAPVLLVGDIDRGGVFAQLYGTVALLEEDERARIKGLIVNKFRGDASILEPGLRQLEALCGIPVAGVVPYTNVDIDDEDSLSERFTKKTARKLLDLAVIRLPRISNFTDFSPFERFDGVSLRYVDRVSDLGAPDMILLPGTKSTIADLQWLRQSGLETAILKEAARGTLIFGVCGGYQMLGTSVSDPGEVEAAGVTQIRGMGLLPMDTVFHGEKVQTQTKGVFSGVAGLLSGLNGLSYTGYEIHMGRSQAQLPPAMSTAAMSTASSTRRAWQTRFCRRCAKSADWTLLSSARSTQPLTRPNSTICWQTLCARGSIWTSSTAPCAAKSDTKTHTLPTAKPDLPDCSGRSGFSVYAASQAVFAQKRKALFHCLLRAVVVGCSPELRRDAAHVAAVGKHLQVILHRERSIARCKAHSIFRKIDVDKMHVAEIPSQQLCRRGKVLPVQHQRRNHAADTGGNNVFCHVRMRVRNLSDSSDGIGPPDLRVFLRPTGMCGNQIVVRLSLRCKRAAFRNQKRLDRCGSDVNSKNIAFHVVPPNNSKTQNQS